MGSCEFNCKVSNWVKTVIIRSSSINLININRNHENSLKFLINLIGELRNLWGLNRRMKPIDNSLHSLIEILRNEGEKKFCT